MKNISNDINNKFKEKLNSYSMEERFNNKMGVKAWEVFWDSLMVVAAGECFSMSTDKKQI